MLLLTKGNKALWLEEDGLDDVMQRMVKAAVAWSEDLKKHSVKKKSMTEAVQEVLEHKIRNDTLVCPDCKKPVRALLWACCKRPFAGGREPCLPTVA